MELLRLAEYLTLIGMLVLGAFTFLLAHYSHLSIPAKRSLYGLGLLSTIIVINRGLRLFDILSAEVILAYAGILYIGIILWVVWPWTRD